MTIIAPDTREKVLSAVKELSYSPNSIGQALRAGHVKSVALLVGDIQQGWYSSLAKSMQLALEADGLDLLLFNLGHSETRLTQILERAVSMKLRGIALATSDHLKIKNLDDVRKRLKASDIPLIAIGRRLDDSGIVSIAHDDVEASVVAVRHLLDRGRKPIAFLSHIEASATGRVRFEGYAKALKEAGVELNANLVWEASGSYRFKAGYEAMNSALKRKLRVRAVLAGSDELALGAMAAAQDAGLSVPSDIAFLGFGGLEWGGYVRPSLTTLDIDTDAFGIELVKLLRDQKALNKMKQRLIKVERQLVIREST